MKTATLVTAVAVLSALFSVAANATGRPSTDEAPAAPIAVVQSSPEVGSYARYLMLNGLSRDEAIEQAKPYDRPSTRPFVSRLARAKTAAPATVQQ